jgi:hypothetical protein
MSTNPFQYSPIQDFFLIHGLRSGYSNTFPQLNPLLARSGVHSVVAKDTGHWGY